RLASWDQIRAVMSPDGDYLVTAEHSGDIARTAEPSRLRLWKVPAELPAETRKLPASERVSGSMISLDGHVIASRASDGTINVEKNGVLQSITLPGTRDDDKAEAEPQAVNDPGQPESERATDPAEARSRTRSPSFMLGSLNEDGDFLSTIAGNA